jgi:putative ABC transport system substrate-binding protein
MRRIGLAIVLALGVIFASLITEAQEVGTVARVGLLTAGVSSDRIEAFKEGLQPLGYIEDQNIIIEVRSSEGKPERLSGLANEFVKLNVSVIVASSSDTTRAAQDVTKTIPIVMALSGDPVGAGFVSSLARPGGNITGFTTVVEGFHTKRLQLLREAVPQVRRIAALSRPENPAHRMMVREIEEAARSLGLDVHLAEVRNPSDLDRAFLAMSKARVGALVVPGDNMFDVVKERLLDLASRNRLPTMCAAKTYVEAGGLSYAADQNDLFRRAANYVDQDLERRETQ